MTGLDGGGIRMAGGSWWGTAPTAPARMPLDEYAVAIAARELILDEAGIRVVGGAVTGDVQQAWSKLVEHASRFGLPMVEGNLERTNRVFEWDELIVGDPLTQDAWRRAYPAALVRAAGLPMEQDVSGAAASHLEKQPTLLWNPFVPLALRRPSVTDELRAFALKRASALPPPPPPPALGVDAAVFPGDQVPNLSDFAKLQIALQGGDFMTTLYKAGLDPMTFARISDRWAKRLAGDAALRAEYAELLKRNGEPAPAPPIRTTPLPIADTIVFPGQKLAKVSDFARISRAAKRGAFKEALAQAGVDADTFANLCARFNARMKEDEAVAAQFKRLLEDPRVDALPTTPSAS